jgi:hypothetical protein
VCEQKKKKKGVEEAHEKDEAQACLLVRAIAHPSHRSHCSYHFLFILFLSFFTIA